jgi:hypothetical protein
MGPIPMRLHSNRDPLSSFRYLSGMRAELWLNGAFSDSAMKVLFEEITK